MIPRPRRCIVSRWVSTHIDPTLVAWNVMQDFWSHSQYQKFWDLKEKQFWIGGIEAWCDEITLTKSISFFWRVFLQLVLLFVFSRFKPIFSEETWLEPPRLRSRLPGLAALPKTFQQAEGAKLATELPLLRRWMGRERWVAFLCRTLDS